MPPDRGDIPAFTPAEAGTRFCGPGGMQGRVMCDSCRCREQTDADNSAEHASSSAEDDNSRSTSPGAAAAAAAAAYDAIDVSRPVSQTSIFTQRAASRHE